MRINFECYTNYNLVALNALKIKLASGSVLTIDRNSTEWYPVTDGKLSMEWMGCYLWAIDDCHIFSDYGCYMDEEGAINEFKVLLKGSTISLLKGATKAWFEYDEDIVDPDDYMVEIRSISINGEVVYEVPEDRIIVDAQADYTSGGIWLFRGRLADGSYFLMDNSCNEAKSVMLLDSDPMDYDKTLYAKWQEEHVLSNLEGNEAEGFMNSLADYLANIPISSKSRGGMTAIEIDKYLRG